MKTISVVLISWCLAFVMMVSVVLHHFDLALFENELVVTTTTTSRSVINGTVGLVGYCVGDKFDKIQPLAEYNRRAYAQKWGYKVFIGNHKELPLESFITPAAWLKAAFLYHLLSDSRNTNVEWFLWLDCDALIARLDWSVSRVLEQELGNVKPHNYMVVAQDPHSPFNTGVMLVRNNEWSRDLWKRTLLAAANETVRHDDWWEQRALHDLYRLNGHDEQEHLYITPHRFIFNALRSERRNDFNSSSFVWHRVNCHMQDVCDGRSLAFFCAHMPDGSYPRDICSNVTPGTPW